jgi:hypothetical protein
MLCFRRQLDRMGDGASKLRTSNHFLGYWVVGMRGRNAGTSKAALEGTVVW